MHYSHACCLGVGRLTTMTDSSGSTTRVYDANGHVIQKTQTVGHSMVVTTS